MWRRTGAGELGEEALDEVLSQEPCLGVKVNSKRPAGHVASHALVSLGYVGRVIVEDELDGGAGRISGIEKLEEFG